MVVDPLKLYTTYHNISPFQELNRNVVSPYESGIKCGVHVHVLTSVLCVYYVHVHYVMIIIVSCSTICN